MPVDFLTDQQTAAFDRFPGEEVKVETSYPRISPDIPRHLATVRKLNTHLVVGWLWRDHETYKNLRWQAQARLRSMRRVKISPAITSVGNRKPATADNSL